MKKNLNIAGLFFGCVTERTLKDKIDYNFLDKETGAVGKRMNLLVRGKMSLLLLFFCFQISISGYGQKQASTSKPNIIYILADDMGYGELGCYGQQKILTPHIDQLAAEGMKFTQHYVGTPVCGPSRCNLLTGRNSGHAYVRGNVGLLPYKENEMEPGSFPITASTPTLGELFKKAGYATGVIGKWGLGNHDNAGDPQKHGFDYFDGYYDQRHAHNYYTTHLYENRKWESLNNPVINVHPKLKGVTVTPEDVETYKGKEYSIDKMTTHALEFISANKSKPFFLYLPYTLPHAALQVPEPDIERYKKLLNESPLLLTTGYVPTFYPLSTYAAMISYLDKQVGLIEEQLKKLGLDKNTIVIFCSDNGPAGTLGPNSNYFNSAGILRGRKQDLYEGGIREPFIVKWPGKIAAGKVSNYPSATYDMMETFAELLRVKAPENDGVSILPTLLGNPSRQKQRAYMYWEYPDKGGQMAIRMGKWKGVKTGLNKNARAPWQIFNLETDEREMIDVAAEHPELLKQFDAIVKKEHQTPVRPEWDLFNPDRPAGIDNGESE
ncbi:MAG: arylsulfatase [Chitinophagaceae bacterium]